MNILPNKISQLSLLIFGSLLLTGPFAHSQLSWAGYSVTPTGWASTPDGYLGWLFVGQPNRSWAYSDNTGDYLYIPQANVTATGAWAYALNLDPSVYDFTWASEGWLYILVSATWVFAPEATVSQSTGWTYILNCEPPPEKIVVTSEFTADTNATDIETRYAKSLRITAAELAKNSDLDPLIVMTTGPGSVTFTNTSFSGNRFAKIAFDKNLGGLLDLTALDGISGKIGVDVHADVNLTATTNGFYSRLRKDGMDIGTFSRLPAAVLEEDIILETYLNNPADNAYIEFTIPWQGSITVYDMYLYMESEVKGFADMAERITGGTGATTENTHTVSNAAEFAAALTAVQEAQAPSIIYLAGTITLDDWTAAGGTTQEATISDAMSNLSIIGTTSDAIFDGVGLKVQGTNIILQNLTIRLVIGRDGIGINNARYIWVDHCSLHNEPLDQNPDKDKYDELISIKNDAQNVILSWNHLYDSHKTILVGSNDEVDAHPDRKVIFHHNWFQTSGSRLPLYRGGHAHIYNNYFLDIDTAINVRTGSKILIENNYFEDVRRAIGYWFDETLNPSGLWEVSGNIFDNVPNDAPTTSTIDINFESSYNYTLDPAADVPDIVTQGAGVNKL